MLICKNTVRTVNELVIDGKPVRKCLCPQKQFTNDIENVISAASVDLLSAPENFSVPGLVP